MEGAGRGPTGVEPTRRQGRREVILCGRWSRGGRLGLRSGFSGPRNRCERWGRGPVPPADPGCIPRSSLLQDAPVAGRERQPMAGPVKRAERRHRFHDESSAGGGAATGTFRYSRPFGNSSRIIVLPQMGQDMGSMPVKRRTRSLQPSYSAGRAGGSGA